MLADILPSNNMSLVMFHCYFATIYLKRQRGINYEDVDDDNDDAAADGGSTTTLTLSNELYPTLSLVFITRSAYLIASPCTPAHALVIF